MSPQISSPYFHLPANQWLRLQCRYRSCLGIFNMLQYSLSLKMGPPFKRFYTMQWNNVSHVFMPTSGRFHICDRLVHFQPGKQLARCALQEPGSIRGGKRSNSWDSSKSNRGISKTKLRYLHHLTVSKTAQHVGKIAVTCCTSASESPRYQTLGFTEWVEVPWTQCNCIHLY